jgi:uncharacterized membrane protein
VLAVYLIVLRLLHIVAGVFWAGTTFFMVSFMYPAIGLAGPGGQDYVRALSQRTRFSAAMSATGLVTVLAGILLYLHDSAYFRSNWMRSSTGITFAIGGVTGIVAAYIGLVISRAVIVRLGALGKEFQAAGGPPPPEKLAEAEALQARLMASTRWIAILLGVTVLAMAVARYIH